MNAKASLMENTNYDQAVAMSSFFSKLFNMYISPDEIMSDANSLANKAIYEYCTLIEILDTYFPSDRYPYEKEDIMAVLNHLVSKDLMLRRKYISFLFFIRDVESVFHDRIMGVRYLREKSIEVSIWNNNRIKRVDTVFFRSQFIRIEVLLDEIHKKREVRKLKKKHDKVTPPHITDSGYIYHDGKLITK